MKLNIELKELDENEASVVLAALNALHTGMPQKVEVAQAPVAEEPAPTPVFTQPAVEPVVPADTKDKDGLSWDERIHSSNHKMNADGRWQRRRNVEDAYYEQVKAELLGTSATPVFETAPCENSVENPTPVQPEVIAPTPLPTEQPQVLTNVGLTAQEFMEAAVPPAEQPVVKTAEPELPKKNTNDLYNEMFAKLQKAFVEKKIDANYVHNTVSSLNALFGKNWTGLGEIKDDANALQFVIDQLAKEGL